MCQTGDRSVYNISWWAALLNWFLCLSYLKFDYFCRSMSKTRCLLDCPFTSPTLTIGANKVMEACYNCSLCHIHLHEWPRFTWWRHQTAPDTTKALNAAIKVFCLSPEDDFTREHLFSGLWADLFCKKEKKKVLKTKRVQVELQGTF